MLFCQTWKIFSAIVPKTSKIIQKSSSFHDFLSEMLLYKCFFGHVKCSFDNLAKNLPVKRQVFLVKVQKRRKTNCSRVFFLNFFLCTLRLLFRHTWLFFCQNQKEFTRSPKKDDNSKNYFIIFSQSFAEDTWNALWRTLAKVFCHKTVTFAQISKRIKQLLFSLLSKKNLKTFRCTRL